MQIIWAQMLIPYDKNMEVWSMDLLSTDLDLDLDLDLDFIITDFIITDFIITNFIITGRQLTIVTMSK